MEKHVKRIGVLTSGGDAPGMNPAVRAVVRTALATSDPFGRYIAIGIGCIVFPHCFINIGMCIGVTPVTGVPLPFISYGGSFGLMGMLAFGILQSVYRHRR